MNNNLYTSRSERQMKRRKNERFLFSVIAVGILFVFMLVFFIFKGNDRGKEADSPSNDSSTTTEITEADAMTDGLSDDNEASDSGDLTSENPSTTMDETDDLFADVVIQSIKSSDDNVKEAFVGNWPPIGTSQEEPHTTEFEDDSQDRIEIREAVLLVTKIHEDNLLEHWIGNGGEQKVIATVEDTAGGDIYRIYLTWVENEGWQPTLVELLKEYIKE